MGFSLKKVVKSVTKPIRKVVKATTKAVRQAGDRIGDIYEGTTGAVTSLARGDFGGALNNLVKGGTAGLTDLNKISKVMGMSKSAPAGAITAGMVANVGKSKGLLSQLRTGKGGIGGGSVTDVAKDPLGGSSGKTGK